MKYILLLSLLYIIINAQEYPIKLNDYITQTISKGYANSSITVNIGSNRIYREDGKMWSPNGALKMRLNVPPMTKSLKIGLIFKPNVGGLVYGRYIDSKSGSIVNLSTIDATHSISKTITKENHYFTFGDTTSIEFKTTPGINGGYIYIDLYRDPDSQGFDDSSETVTITYTFEPSSQEEFNTWVTKQKFHPITQLPVTDVKTINYTTFPTTKNGSFVKKSFTPKDYSVDNSYLILNSLSDYPNNFILVNKSFSPDVSVKYIEPTHLNKNTYKIKSYFSNSKNTAFSWIYAIDNNLSINTNGKINYAMNIDKNNLKEKIFNYIFYNDSDTEIEAVKIKNYDTMILTNPNDTSIVNNFEIKGYAFDDGIGNTYYVTSNGKFLGNLSKIDTVTGYSKWNVYQSYPNKDNYNIIINKNNGTIYIEYKGNL